MFTSKQHLHNNLGVDEHVAAFFVDRKIPEHNWYWKERLLYVSKGTGYLFIPLFFDLQLKCGLSLHSLLSEDYINVAEQILNSAAMHELEQISFKQHLGNCKNIIATKIKNPDLYRELDVYFENEQLKPYKNIGTESKALNRGDTFLFSICFLDLNKEITDKILLYWYALVPSFLLMDDIYDIQEDQKKNEENSVDDFGPGVVGIERAIAFLREKFSQLKVLNEKLGSYFENSLEKKIRTPYMQFLLNGKQ
jgi:hypothetical protein